MDINHKTIDNKTRGEVGALFQGYVVQPLTEELQTKLEKDASDEDSGTDGLTTYQITAKQLNNGRKIYSLNVTCHTPYSIKEAAGHE